MSTGSLLTSWKGSAWAIALLLLFQATSLWGADGGADWKPPERKAEVLSTEDGLELHAYYYEGYRSRETVPVIVLHGFKGSSSDVDPLCRELQSYAHAVLSLDLRGHGASKSYAPVGEDKLEKLEPHLLGADDFQHMVAQDMEAAKRYLMQRNNREELNINSLVVVGCDLGASIAFNWGALDWSWPELPAGKQGQDVKAIVMVSPEWNRKGITISDAAADPVLCSNVALELVVGRSNSKAMQDAQRLFDMVKKYHPKVSAEIAPPLCLDCYNTSLQGSKLLQDKKSKLEFSLTNAQPGGDPAYKDQAIPPSQRIAIFIEDATMIANPKNPGDRRAKYPWTNRKSK